MTSLPSLGTQQLPQQRIAGGGGQATVHSRTSSQASSTAGHARKPGLSVDLSTSGYKSSPGESQAARSGNGNPSPATPVLEPPNRSANISRGGKPHINPSEAAAVQVSVTERPASSAIAPTLVTFPPRPGQYVPEKHGQALWAGAGASTFSKTDPKSHSLEPPAAAILYPEGKTADFNPWAGNHPEDNLTEQTVKSGFQNKPLITNETNTARPSLWSHLKNKSGLQTLSSLFVTVLEKRQTSGRLTGASTFKPPPRVTLTNTKREAWLSDLANPAFALRRLNRTIPYGINGKILLEQCLSKEIPTARAVWLAKCIGANELRTLKRKGVTGAPGISGELKWIREWTMHVEQFVESTITSCGEGNWKEKMQYAIRLIFHLFVEQLLDKEHYLDWILSSLESSTTERLPMWLVHIQLYWKFLVSNRKRGRRLAECLCAHLELGSSEDDGDLLSPVFHRVQLLIATLAVSQHGCLILPRTWNKYEHLLLSLAAKSRVEHVQTAIHALGSRNSRLTKPIWNQLSNSISSSKRRIFQILDDVGLDFSVNSLTSQFLELFGSAQEMIPVILQWSSSLYREGPYRVYIASRVLRRCKTLGADVEMGVLAFLMDLPEASGIDESKVSRIVAELVRSKQFAVARLLQSMIATGLASSSNQDTLITRRLIHLVEDIPTQDLPQHVSDLRQIILRNTNRNYFEINQNLSVIQRTLYQAISAGSISQTKLRGEFYERLQLLTLSEKLGLSMWLRQEVLNQANTAKGLGEDDSTPISDEVFNPQIFYIARDVLEHIEDFAFLADVVAICFATDSIETVSAAVDTLHYHSQCFGAIGALRPLVADAVERYQTLRNAMPLDRSFLHSLLDLFVTIKTDDAIIQQLNYDIARYDQRNTMTICSPASDNAVEMLNSTPMDSDDEIERILSSGTTMDEQIIERVFNRLVLRLNETSPNDSKLSRCGQWFSRLKGFDDAAFDGVLRKWLIKVLLTSDQGFFPQTIVTLVGSESLSLSTFVQIADECRQNMGAEIDRRKLSIEVAVLDTLLPRVSLLPTATVPEWYKCNLERRKFATEFPDVVMKHLRRALDLSEALSEAKTNELLRLLVLSPAAIGFLRDRTVHSKSFMADQSYPSVSRSGWSHSLYQDVLGTLLDPTDQFGLSTMSKSQQLARLIQKADDLSLPFCQLKVQHLLTTGTEQSRDNTNDLASALFDAILSIQDSDHPTWLELLEGLDKAVLLRLGRLAEIQVLKRVNDHVLTGDITMSAQDSPAFPSDRAVLRKLLCIIDCTTVASSGYCPPDIGAAFTEILGVIRDLFGRYLSQTLEIGSDMKASGVQISGSEACHYLDALLHLLVVHKNSTQSQKTSPLDSASVLPSLLSLLAYPSMKDYPSTSEFIFDIAAYFSDDLTEDVRTQLLKSESYKQSDDPRISFLLGPPQSADGWVSIVMTNNTSSVPASSGGPPTPAARFGAGQQQQAHVRPQQPGRPAPPQRQGSMQGQQKMFSPPAPFPLRRWELLPDQGSNTGSNDTAISLNLFGARKV